MTRCVLHDAPPHGPAEVDAASPGATVIDVRTPEGFARLHLASAVNVPLDEILAGRTPAEAGNGVVVVCARGARSTQAHAALEARGVRGLASLRGGLERYRGD